jgi:acyl-CoA synthetase (AMP-forming)/AMP-acid ligase II
VTDLPDTIASELQAAAADSGNTTVLEYDGESVSFAELHVRVRAAAVGLIAAGVAAGDRVAVWAPNTLEAAIALLAVPLTGAASVPLNTRYQHREAAEIVERAGCALVLAPAAFLGRDYAAEAAKMDGPATVVSLGPDASAGTLAWATLVTGGTKADEDELAARAAAQSGDGVVLIQYTSGTTGRPKGAALRQGPMLATARTWARVSGFGRGDTGLITYPMAHIGGFKTGLLTTIVARATSALFPVVDAESLIALTAQYRPTVLAAPPPVLRTLLDAVRDGRLPATRLISTVVTGSSIVPPTLVRELTSTLVRDVINAYGLTETTGTCTMTRRGDPVDVVCETIGYPVDGVEVRIASDVAATGDGEEPPVGEIEVRGANVMVGYLDDPAATAEVMDGDWLRTGDVGWIDSKGYVRIVGRAKDMVIVGGFNVYPAEVEHVLAAHPGVAEAAAVGVPDERLGEVVAAFVVPSGKAQPDDAELTGWCRERLANFKVPRHLWAVRSLPRANAGKIAKGELRAAALRRLGR